MTETNASPGRGDADDVLDAVVQSLPEITGCIQDTHPWAGDVWKILKFIRVNRPDVEVHVSPVFPTGLAFVTFPNGTRSDWWPTEEAVGDCAEWQWQDFLAEKEVMQVLENDRQKRESFLARCRGT